MMVILEMEGDRIRRVIISDGDRPDFVGEAAIMSKKKGANDSTMAKHAQKQSEKQMCHVVAWSILTKRARRIFKGMTLDQADEWLGHPGNWPDGKSYPNTLVRSNTSRAMGLNHFSLVTKESVQQCIEVWLKTVNSWVDNLWLGPGDRNEAKGRMLKRCVTLVKQACWKSQPLYLGANGTIRCLSGDRQAEILVEAWGMNDERAWQIGNKRLSTEELQAGELYKQSPQASFFILRAGMSPQKLYLKARDALAEEQSSAIYLTPTYMYIKVSREFSWEAYFGMIQGKQVLNEKNFGDTPFAISDFKSLENFLLFSAIDLEADVNTQPGVPPSSIPAMFGEGYGHYIKRLQYNQEFNKLT